MTDKILAVVGWLVVAFIFLSIANLLTGCTANVIQPDEWPSAIVIRESSGDGGASYMAILRGETDAQSCGVATRGQPIEGLTVQYRGEMCEVSYDGR